MADDYLDDLLLRSFKCDFLSPYVFVSFSASECRHVGTRVYICLYFRLLKVDGETLKSIILLDRCAGETMIMGLQLQPRELYFLDLVRLLRPDASIYFVCGTRKLLVQMLHLVPFH